MRILRAFIVSTLLLTLSVKATACYCERIDRWYMFCLGNSGEEFGEKFRQQSDAFWSKYCNTEAYHIDTKTRLRAAKRKEDKEMAEYVQQLGEYLRISDEVSYDAWRYPTASDLAGRTATLERIVSVCKPMHSGKYRDRWVLLEMRANMMLKNHEANKRLWTALGNKMPAGYCRDMMRNIYANALLNTGEKVKAWNIYAEQNDIESLKWSIRKYTNLAGIKKLYEESPTAPVIKCMLTIYVNSMQELMDRYDDSHGNYKFDPKHEDGWYYTAYAPISAQYASEAREFVKFASQVARGGKTDCPCLWMSASALVSYFLHDYATAKTCIEQAMAMHADADTRAMARRIRMLIIPAASDINTMEFKKFMAAELQWLDSQIRKGKDYHIFHARDRILNLGLCRTYYQQGNPSLAVLMQAVREKCIYESWRSNTAVLMKYDYSTQAFSMLDRMSTKQLREFNAYLDSCSNDPLALYAKRNTYYTADYLNDLIGTKYLARGEFDKALPYLKAVPMQFLQRQAIAFYAAKRDYTRPEWYGRQVAETRDNYPEAGRITPLKTNVKVDFCNDMLRLQQEYKTTSGDRHKELALALAIRYYQASGYGQCWYITDYRYTTYQEEVPEFYYIRAKSPFQQDLFANRANKLLQEAASSSNPTTKAEALFGLVGMARDDWYDEELDTHYTWKKVIKHNSMKYLALKLLTKHLDSSDKTPAHISRCDVIKQFRKINK